MIAVIFTVENQSEQFLARHFVCHLGRGKTQLSNQIAVFCRLEKNEKISEV